MNSDKHREPENTRASNQNSTKSASYDIVAVSHEGKHLYVAKRAWGARAAESEREKCQNLIESDSPLSLDVSHFIVQERKKDNSDENDSNLSTKEHYREW